MSRDEAPIRVDGRTLSLEAVERAASDPSHPFELPEEARERIRRARMTIEGLVDGDEAVYGVVTGFGRLADVRIGKEDRARLQENLLRSHAAGTGAHLSPGETRAILLLRANALAVGHSGCRVEVVQRLLEFLSRRIHPAIPEAGSVGASGDLAPLAHAALPLIGEGWLLDPEGGVRDAAPVLRAEALEPLRLREKEGLALINGTQATTALGVLAFQRIRRSVDTLEVAGAMTLEALQGTPEAFRSEVQACRPHPGQIRSAELLRELLRDSEIRESHRHGDPRIQDAYSIRCMPQIHGAARSTLGYVEGVLATEVNSATDNPLVFPREGRVVSAGNFHAQIVAQALDFLSIAVADLAAVSERRLERLLNPDLSGLPAFLTPRPGIHSGYMILQVTVADLLGELRVLAHPVSVDSVPTSGNQEDHISMGMAAARKIRRGADLLERIVATELLAAAQGLEFRQPLRPGVGVRRAYEAIRSKVRPLDADRVPGPDLDEVLELVRSGALVAPRLAPA